MKFMHRNRDVDRNSDDTAVASHANSMDSPARDGDNPIETAREKNLRLKSSKIPNVTLRTATMALLVAMGGFIFGYDTGQISGFLEMQVFLERFGEPTAVSETNQYGYYFTNVRSGLIVAMLSIGTLIGCLIAGPIANRIGRKWSIPPWCMVFCIGVVIQMAVGTGQWIGIVMGRWVAGLGVGALSVLVPLYMAESSPIPVRGSVISCYQLFITIGIFTADCINFGTEKLSSTASYRVPMGIGFFWAIILGVGIMFLPESPRYDWNRNQQNRARTTMAKFYGLSEDHRMINKECDEIEHIRLATEGDHPWYEAITGPRMFYRIALAMSLQMLQQLTGANYFFYYGTTVFKKVGIQNSYVTAMILGGVNVGSTFLGVWMARHFRRRESLYWGAIWMFCCFMVFASVGQFVFRDAAEGSSIANTSGTVMIVFSCLFIVAFATTWGPLVWASISEMFPYRYRAVAMGCATSANWFWNFMLAFFTPFIVGDIQFAYGYVFAGCNLAAAALVYFFMIESSGRSLEEVDAMYLMHVPPRKSARFEFDEETQNQIGDGGIGSDRMYLRHRGGKLEKADEGGVGAVFQKEESVHEATGQEHARNEL